MGHHIIGVVNVPGLEEVTPSFSAGRTGNGAQEARGKRIVNETIEFGERVVVKVHQRHVLLVLAVVGGEKPDSGIKEEWRFIYPRGGHR